MILACAPAAAAAEAASGYVVKVESGSVYIDFGDKTGAAVGQSFSVYTEGMELKHPVSGQSLGKIETAVAVGRVTQVLPLYSVGSLRQDAGKVQSGMRAKLGAKPAPAAVAAPTDGVPARKPRWKSAGFDYAIAGMALADFRGEGKTTLALADKKTVVLYAYPPEDPQPLAQFVPPGIGPRILSLSAGDLNGNGRAELFVTLHNETLARAETVVLEWTDGQWRQLADIPWLVRQFQDGSGETVLGMQQLLEDQTFPFSSIYRLSYRDGKYAPTEPIRFKHVNFLYDFTQAALPGAKEPALLYETATDHVQVQFKGGFWKTPETYGQTPSRLRWHSRLLEFHPQMPVLYEGGKAAVYLIKNTSALGALADPFGLFTGGQIERHAWDGAALAPQWRADLDGYCSAAQPVPSALKAVDLAVAVTGTAGRSAVWIFDP